MTVVVDLRPGDLVRLGPIEATFIAQTQHPIWPALRLVVWRFYEGHPLSLEWSHDALSPMQDVGEVVESGEFDRMRRLKLALIGARP